ncbi:MAG: MMPL family transporter [Marinilabiliaceae bacterium]|nr:MMPL family transporter [Marinilabiliaceae bacterium]
MWTWIARLILRNRIPFLVALGLVTLFMGYQARKIEMSYQYAALLPKEDSTYVEYENFIKTFGNESNLVVFGIQDDQFFKLRNFQEWLNLTASLKKIHGVTAVLSAAQAYDLVKNVDERKFEVKPLFPDNVLYQTELDSLRHRFESLPFYREVLYNSQTHAYLLAITLDNQILASKDRVRLIEEIKQLGTEFEVRTKRQLHYSGMPYIRVTTAEMIKSELNMFILLTLAVTALIIFLFFRSFKVVIYSMLVVGISVVWALGIQSMLGYRITILTGMIPPLLIVIGIPNVVYLLNKYHHEFRIHGNQIKALQRVIRKIGNATFMTNLTTALGFGTFIFTSSRILVEFGVVASINIMGIFVISILLIPIIFSFVGAPAEKHVKHLDSQFSVRIINWLVGVSLDFRKGVFIAVGIIIVVSIWGISKIHTTGYMLDDIQHDDPLYLDLKFFEANFNGLMPLEVVIDTKRPNGILRGNTLKKMDELETRLSAMPEISKPLSLTQVVKFARQAFFNGREQHFKVPSTEERNFILSYVAKGGQAQGDLIRSFIDSTRQSARISFRMKDVGTTHMKELDAQIRSVVDSVFVKDNFDVSITGGSVVSFKGTSYLISNLMTSVLLAVFLIAVFMALMFRSWRMVVISLIPNVLPLMVTAALMGFFNVPIKPSTILVFSIAFGISVDGTIHYLAKYRQELGQTNWSIRAAVVLATKETGVSMVYTATILFFGFGIFSASDFGGTVALGTLVAITLVIALISNLILLPSVLLGLEKLATDRSFSEPLLQIYDEEEDIDPKFLKIARKDEA